MKTIMYLLLAIISLMLAICALFALATQPTNGVQVLGLIALAVFSLACIMIFGYSFYHHMKEDRLYDLAAKEQLDTDYENANYGY